MSTHRHLIDKITWTCKNCGKTEQEIITAENPDCITLREMFEQPMHTCTDGEPCRPPCAVARWRERQVIIDDGYEAICIPKLGNRPGHHEHDHIRGEKTPEARRPTLADEVKEGRHDHPSP